MATLLLRLAGPLQSWGANSRFTVRATRRAPTKSGIIGLIAAAQGRRRSDPMEDLLALQIAVRIDQPGSLLSDFQTAINSKGKAMPLSERHYLEDAVFVAGVEGPRPLLEGIKDALSHPKFPLFLGRRSCPPSLPLVLELVDKPLLEALSPNQVPWQAATWFMKRVGDKGYDAEILSDVPPAGAGNSAALQEMVSDIPISFDMEHRRYSWRTVYRSRVQLKQAQTSVVHDPLEVLEDA